MSDEKMQEFEKALGLYRVAVQAGDPTDSYRRLIRLYGEAVKDGLTVEEAQHVIGEDCEISFTGECPVCNGILAKIRRRSEGVRHSADAAMNATTGEPIDG